MIKGKSERREDSSGYRSKGLSLPGSKKLLKKGGIKMNQVLAISSSPLLNLANRLPTKVRAVVVWFLVSITLLAILGLGYAAYCTFKGGSFYYVVRLSAFYVKIACII